MSDVQADCWSGFYPDVNGDRMYSADDFGLFFKLFFTNGVFCGSDLDGLQILAGENMTLTVNPGAAFAQGHLAVLKNRETLTLTDADGVYPRIDRVIMRHYCGNGVEDERKMCPVLLTGTPAASPVPPEIVRDGTYYDLSLATVYVEAGALEITGADITDTRYDEEVCGFVRNAHGEPLTAKDFLIQCRTLFDQMVGEQRIRFDSMMAAMNGELDSLRKWTASFKISSAAEFADWFNGLKNMLDENTEAHLFNLISVLSSKVDMLESVIFNAITANPYIIRFENLDGLAVNGVWNREKQRVEC